MIFTVPTALGLGWCFHTMKDRPTALLLIAVALAGYGLYIAAAYVNRQHGPRID